MTSLSNDFLPHVRENLVLLISEYSTWYEHAYNSDGTLDPKIVQSACLQLATLGHSQKRLLRRNRTKIQDNISRDLNPLFLAPLFEDIADAYLILSDTDTKEVVITPKEMEELVQGEAVKQWLWNLRHCLPPSR